jgi:hypothetical protein
MLKAILFLYKIVNYLTPPSYYYYNNGNFMNISIIIYILDLLLVGFLVKEIIFENNIYCVKDNKVWSYSENLKRKLSTKIIKNIIYQDSNFIIKLDEIKKNIYNIDVNIDIVFLLYLFNNIIVNEKSYISVTYFNSDTKYVKVDEGTKLATIF